MVPLNQSPAMRCIASSPSDRTVSVVAGPRPARRSADRMRSLARPSRSRTAANISPLQSGASIRPSTTSKCRRCLCVRVAPTNPPSIPTTMLSAGVAGVGLLEISATVFSLDLLPNFENAVADRGVVEAVGVRQELLQQGRGLAIGEFAAKLDLQMAELRRRAMRKQRRHWRKVTDLPAAAWLEPRRRYADLAENRVDTPPPTILDRPLPPAQIEFWLRSQGRGGAFGIIHPKSHCLEAAVGQPPLGFGRAASIRAPATPWPLAASRAQSRHSRCSDRYCRSGPRALPLR